MGQKGELTDRQEKIDAALAHFLRIPGILLIIYSVAAPLLFLIFGVGSAGSGVAWVIMFGFFLYFLQFVLIPLAAGIMMILLSKFLSSERYGFPLELGYFSKKILEFKYLTLSFLYLALLLSLVSIGVGVYSFNNVLENADAKTYEQLIFAFLTPVLCIIIAYGFYRSSRRLMIHRATQS